MNTTQIFLFIILSSSCCLLVSLPNLTLTIYFTLKLLLKITAYIDLEIQDFKQILGGQFSDFSNVRVKKLNKTTRGLFGNINLMVSDFDNSMQVEAKMSKKQGGEYRKLPYRLPPKKLCDFFNEDIFFYPDLVKTSNLPLPFPCPIKPV
jgi:hypothetical protein